MSTDSSEIADVARRHGGDVPFLRPGDLARDETPMWPVLRHALEAVERQEGRTYDYLLLLDPTSPGRQPSDIEDALVRLSANERADGIIGVSRPPFNPIWHCVIERDGWMQDLIADAPRYARRQDVPTVYRINAMLYAWRATFVRREAGDWRANGRHLVHELPDERAVHIDEPSDFAHAELLVQHGLVTFPWLATSGAS